MRLQLKITPGAKQTRLLGWQENILKVAIHAPADKGKANTELIVFLSGLLGLAQREIVLVQGAGSRMKIVDIPISENELRARLPP